jgi:hypothetical protein
MSEFDRSCVVAVLAILNEFAERDGLTHDTRAIVVKHLHSLSPI